MQAELPVLPRNGKPAGPSSWLLLFCSIFLFMSVLFASIATLPTYSLFLGSTPFQAGLQNTVFAVAAIIFRFALGPHMDRRGPKPLMLLGIFTFATTPLLLISSPTYTMLLAARVYQALGLAVVLPGMSTLVAEMAPAGRIGTSLGGLRIAINLSLLAGPAAAILIIEEKGYNTWFAAASVSCFLSLALLAALKTPAVVKRAEKASRLFDQFRQALSVREIYPAIAGIAVFSFSYSTVLSFAEIHIESSSPGIEAARFFILLGAGGIAASLFAGALSDRLGRARVAWPMLVILGLGAFLFSFIARWPALVFICPLLLGMGIQGSGLVFTAWLIDRSKPELRATTISVQENTIDVFFAVGALSFGLAAQGPGLGPAFLVSGLLTVAAALLLSRAAALNRGLS